MSLISCDTLILNMVSIKCEENGLGNNSGLAAIKWLEADSKEYWSANNAGLSQ